MVVSLWGLIRAAQSTSQAIRGASWWAARAEGSITSKTYEPWSRYPEGRPTCALICWLAALLDGWRLDESQRICWWSAKKTAKCSVRVDLMGSLDGLCFKLYHIHEPGGLWGYCGPGCGRFNARVCVCPGAGVFGGCRRLSHVWIQTGPLGEFFCQ